MEFVEEFAGKVKAYYEEDLDRKVLEDTYKSDIYPFLERLKSEIGDIKKEDYAFELSDKAGRVKIGNQELNIKLKKRTIKVTKHANGMPEDIIEVSQGKPFSRTRQEYFEIKHLEQYLNETFRNTFE